jgi:integrase
VRTGATFAEAAAEYLRYAEHDRGCKPSTVRGYRSVIDAHLLPAFGDVPVEDITTDDIDTWISTVDRSARTRNNLLIALHGILERARKVDGLTRNAAADVEKFPIRHSEDIDVYSPEEVLALVRAAASEQDAAIYLTAAFTRLRRGELLALRWRDVDFAVHTIRVRASYADGALTTPKSGKVRSVPMAPEVATALAKLSHRGHSTDDDGLVFLGEFGGYVDGSALRRRYDAAVRAAGLRPLRFHDLRHTFGTRMIAKADMRRVQEWMGHADIQTTMKYLHYAPAAGRRSSGGRGVRRLRPVWRRPSGFYRLAVARYRRHAGERGLRRAATRSRSSRSQVPGRGVRGWRTRARFLGQDSVSAGTAVSFGASRRDLSQMSAQTVSSAPCSGIARPTASR